MKCILLGILVLLLLITFIKQREGFQVEPPQALLPKPKQISFISADAATATTANPFLAQPDYRDWWEARDAFQMFLESYTPEIAAKAGITEQANRMLLQAPQGLALIRSYIRNPEEVPTRSILREAKQARRMANAMRQIGPMNPSLPWNSSVQPSRI